MEWRHCVSLVGRTASFRALASTVDAIQKVGMQNANATFMNIFTPRASKCYLSHYTSKLKI